MGVTGYLGIDVGSVTTKLAVLDGAAAVLAALYLPTGGEPVTAVQEGLRRLEADLDGRVDIRAAAATGSARELAGAITGADLVKNEITCQAIAAVQAVPEVQTILEIGGQDSKLICIRDGLVSDFGMNTVCAAGTGSFLDHQAIRLKMTIEEFSRRAVRGTRPVKLSGRCTVFAESDMIHKQQTGHAVDDIIYGLCRALVQNYLSDVAAGKEVLPPVVFQGGVAFNQGIVRALEEELGMAVVVPPRHEVMGAIGAALLAWEHADAGASSTFKGLAAGRAAYHTGPVTCDRCPTACDIMIVREGGVTIAAWGNRCDKWHINLVEQGVQ